LQLASVGNHLNKKAVLTEYFTQRRQGAKKMGFSLRLGYFASLREIKT